MIWAGDRGPCQSAVPELTDRRQRAQILQRARGVRHTQDLWVARPQHQATGCRGRQREAAITFAFGGPIAHVRVQHAAARKPPPQPLGLTRALHKDHITAAKLEVHLVTWVNADEVP